MSLQAVVEWVFAPLIASIRREAYKAGREDALEDIREMIQTKRFMNPLCGSSHDPHGEAIYADLAVEIPTPPPLAKGVSLAGLSSRRHREELA